MPAQSLTRRRTTDCRRHRERWWHNTSLPTDSAGNYVIESEPAGNYTASVTAPGYVTGTASVTVANDANTQTIFALTEDGTISGTVTDAQTHATIVGATVMCPLCPVTSGVTNGSGGYSSRTSRQARHIRSRQASVAINADERSADRECRGETVQNFQLSKSLSVAETLGAADPGSTGSTTLAAVPVVSPTGTGDLLVAAIKLRVGTGAVKVSSVPDSAGSGAQGRPSPREAGSTTGDDTWRTPRVSAMPRLIWG